jgi:heptosyltransferase-3
VRILLSKRRGLGDTVLLSSTLAVFKERFPAAEITVLVPEAFAPVLEGNPHVHELWTYEETSKLGLLWRIRAEKFDYYFNLHSTLGWGEFLAHWSGAKRAYTHIQNRDAVKVYGKHPNALEWDALFLQRVFPDQKKFTVPMPTIYLRDEERAWAKDFLTRRGLEGKRSIFLGLGASRSTKRWPADLVARFSELLRDRLSFGSVFVVGPEDAEQEFAGQVLNHLRVKGFKPQATNKAEGGILFESGLTIRQLAALLGEVRAYVGNDSGPKHLAVAVGTPTVTIFGPEDPGEWHPYDRLKHPLFFIEGLNCRKEDGGRWCSLSECIVEKHRCMKNVDPIDVLQTMERLVSG